MTREGIPFIFSIYSENFKGIDFNILFKYVKKDSNGLNFTGLANFIDGTNKGINFAGIENDIKGDSEGVNLAGIYNQCGNVNKWSISYATLGNVIENVNKDAFYLQIGLYNRAGNRSCPILNMGGIKNLPKLIKNPFSKKSKNLEQKTQ